MTEPTLTTIYLTVPPADAEEIATALVDERLAACVNRIPCESTYRWDDDVTMDTEEIMLAKTTVDRAPELVDRIRTLHPYEVPCIERFDATTAHDPFADWCGDAVSPDR